MSMPHDSLILFLSPASIDVVSQSAGESETLRINRGTKAISVERDAATPTLFEKRIPIYGVYGLITLLKDQYLIVITKRQRVSHILDTNIFNATEFAVYPISSHKQEHKSEQEMYLLSLLKTHLFSSPLYYSYGPYNLTSRLQTQMDSSNRNKPFDALSDDRFFWNYHLAQPLMETQGATRFVLPVIFGFFEVQPTSINDKYFNLVLISRRSRFRAGTRYFSRGIDSDGHVSNFNETEQIVITSDAVANATLLTQPTSPLAGPLVFSYVQTRGSVPLYWAEINNLRYKPDMKIMDLPSTVQSAKLHFDEQVAIYGDQHIVNLVNQKGYEKPIKEGYERLVEAIGNPHVHYTYFDFHYECKGLRFDRVSLLLDLLEESLVKQGYFCQALRNAAGEPENVQTSVVRTNCMDCLDRTNVVQSALAKRVLAHQLRQAGILDIRESLDEHEKFMAIFRGVWADNADVVSKAYSGTGALKTDYTRTGKRTKEGALQDGINSVIRYIKNNFFDGPRQDAYDLVTGAWSPRAGQETILTDKNKDLLTRIIPWVCAVSFLALVSSSMIPSAVAFYIASPKKVFFVSLFVAGFSFSYLSRNGISFVNWPRLKPLTDVIFYSGKGYESSCRGRPSSSRVNTSVSGTGPSIVPVNRTPHANDTKVD